MGFERPTRVDASSRDRLPRFACAVVTAVFLSGCDSALIVNQSPGPAVIRVSSQWGEEGVPPGITVAGGKAELDPNESSTRQFIAPPFALSEPGNLYSLLRFDAGNGQIEEAFLPKSSTCVVTLNAQNFLELAVLPPLEDADFRNELLARNPALKRALETQDHFTAAEVLLNWAANHVDDALSSNDSAITLPLVVKNPVVQSYYELFKPDKGAVVCAGFAVMLQKLLLYFDVDAVIVDFGDPATGLTHMSVVVPEQLGDGTWTFYQFDPKLNFRCATVETGAPLGLFEVMDLELLGQFATVEIVQGSNADRDFVGSTYQLQDPRYQFLRQKGDRYIYHRADYSLQAHVTDYAPQFAAGGFTPGPAGFFELMQKQFYTVRRGNNQASRDAFVQELTRRKIPLIYPKYQ